MVKVAFCFIIKDGESYLEKNINKIINFGNKYTKEFKIYYAENDSVDSTKIILSNIKNKYNNIYGKHLKLDGKHSTQLCTKLFEKYNCSNRTRRLAYLRNIVLNLAKKWKEADYLFMLDLDFVEFNEKELYNMFNIIKYNKNIDGIFGMSVTKHKRNCLYDLGAVTPIYKKLFIMNQYKMVKVNSAFSGFGIYRMKLIINKNLKYNIKTNNIEHIDFNKNFNNLYVYTLFRPVYEGQCFYKYFIGKKFKICCLLLLLFIIIIISKKILKNFQISN
jgi:hypothetical protein